jgi:hypothetical protein
MNMNEREFHKIHRNLNSSLRFKKIYNVKFLKYSISIVDAQSFIYQFKEIFVNEVYKFNSESKSPVIFDCGSNVGTSVLYFKSIYPDAKIKLNFKNS